VADPSKTEKATPKRQSEVRNKGQVAKSPEVNAAAVLIGGVAALWIAGPRIFATLKSLVEHGLQQSGDISLATNDGIPVVARWALLGFAAAVAPVLITTALMAFLANVAQVKFKVTPKAIKPDLSRLNPLPGFKRIVGPQSLVELAKSLAKLGIIGSITFFAVWPQLDQFAALVGLPPAEILSKLCGIVLSIALRACVAFGVIAALDFVYQRKHFQKNIKMTKDEVKREGRDQDIAPELKGAMKRKQFEMGRKRMLAAIPTADVVVTNPTHYAIALRYDGKRPAPEIVAKGVDHLALTIREIAREHNVPILENPPLARALYREVEVGQMIPEAFFAAVAEILAYVFRIASRRRRALAAGA
jgi:flagellar biosynthetic protein FlhB